MVGKDERFRRAFIGTSLDGYIEASRVTQLDKFVREEEKPKEEPIKFEIQNMFGQKIGEVGPSMGIPFGGGNVMSSYVNPSFRLRQELEKRGFKKGELNGTTIYTRWKIRKYTSPPVEYPERAWVAEQPRRMGIDHDEWSPYWSPAPNDVSSLGLFPSEDAAIDSLLAEIDFSE